MVLLKQSTNLVQDLYSDLQNQGLEPQDKLTAQSQQNTDAEAQCCFSHGLQQLKNGNLSEAALSYKRAINIQSKAYEYWFNMGLNLFHLSNYEAVLTSSSTSHQS